jgi:hypothetical protein
LTLVRSSAYPALLSTQAGTHKVPACSFTGVAKSMNAKDAKDSKESDGKIGGVTL